MDGQRKEHSRYITMDEAIFHKLTCKRKELAKQLKDPAAAGFWNMVVDKYSDQAHFIYELLQNADDANASYAELHLNRSEAIFVHNGTEQFSLTDAEFECENSPKGHINSITSIGASSKTDGNKIGKFGIGFKSVFLYTNNPHIEDDIFSFSIEDFIVPYIDQRTDLIKRKNGETVFVLPFFDKETAFVEIENKISCLDFPLHFLNNIKNFSCIKNGNETVIFEKKEKDHLKSETLDYHFSENCVFKNNLSEVEYFHTFSCKLNDSTCLNCSVAIECNENGFPINSKKSGSVYCFFPTLEDSKLNFIINAPFLLTENRESIKKQDQWNKDAIKAMADLACRSITFLCSEKSLINDNIFDIIPLRKSDFIDKKNNSNIFYSDFYTNFVNLLKTGNVFLSDNGYINASKARYSDEKNIPVVFSNEIMNLLLPDEQGKKWTFRTIYQTNDADRNQHIKEIQNYLQTNKIGELFNAEKIGSLINKDLIENSDTEWLVSFYQFVSSHKVLYDGPNAILKDKEYILCSDNKARCLFLNNSTEHQIFIESESNDHYCINKEILKNDKCKDFFENRLKITKPGIFSLISSKIQKYKKNIIKAEDKDTIYSDFNLILDYFSDIMFDTDKRDSLISLIKNFDFLPATNSSGEKKLSCTNKLYFDSKNTKNYFKGNKDILFLDNDIITEGTEPYKRENAYRLLGFMGVSFYPKILKTTKEANDDVLKKHNLSPKSLRQYDNGNQKISDKEFEGYDQFLKNITKESSAAFFSLLKNFISDKGAYIFNKDLEGEYTYVERNKNKATAETIYRTTAQISIFHTRWLYNTAGQLCTPAEINESTNLAECYDTSSAEMLLFLGIKHNPILSKLSETQRRAIKLAEKAYENGISIDKLEEIINNIIAKI